MSRSGPQDSSRSAPSFLARWHGTAQQAGADRLRLADTVGVWNPFQVHAAILALRAAVPKLAIGFHGHNDLGMATANTLAAVLAGAASAGPSPSTAWASAPGNAPLEEVVMALRLTLNHKCGIDATRFSELSALGHRSIRQAAPVGEARHRCRRGRHESGIHVRGMLTEARTSQPFAARAVGHRGTEIVLGKHSGTAAIRHVLAKEGVALSTEEASRMLANMPAAAGRECSRVSV